MFKAYGKAISNYFNFSGRTRRKDFWGFLLTNVLIGVVLGIIGGATGTQQTHANGVQTVVFPSWLYSLLGLYEAFLFIPSLALTFRRLHDSGKSGWYLLWSFLPLIGAIILFVRLYLKKGDAGDNKYGADPKAEIANV